ncbi:MAG TPA: sigma-70 family RNA polymerase sigma factor [Polyangiaceae bacterium]|nr:sigma-70 family RNA polymerase sigma factor [Polyangiaceae bacterium]
MAPQMDTQVAQYISHVQAYPQLSREEETRLTRLWLDCHDENARSLIVESHLRYVVAIALRYRRYGIPVSELIAEGNFGVVHALDKYDPDRGTRFVTYGAYWIRAYILNHIIRSWSLVGVGSGALRSKMFFKLRRERVRITNLVGEGDHADEMLAEALHLPTAKVVSMMRRLEARDVSLDSKVYDDSVTTLGDTLVATDVNQEDAASAKQVDGYLRDAVHDAVALLDERERFIVENRLMADAEEELSLAEIGRRLGVSRERARQLEARAKRKLKLRIEELSAAGTNWRSAA